MKRRSRPWLFALLAALILLAGGTAVGLAARLMVAPQAGQTVEVDTPTPPSFVSQSVDEVTFYPWNRYDPDSFTSQLSGDDEGITNWYVHHLTDGAAQLLGLSLEDWTVQDALMDDNLCYWKDRPAVTADGQSVLLDVSYGKDNRDLGMTWVARSTGELPTRVQKEAALDKVRQDVCDLFAPQEDPGDLSQILLVLYEYLYQFANSFPSLSEFPGAELNGVAREWYAAEIMDTVFSPIYFLATTDWLQPGLSTQQQLDVLSTAAQDLDYHIQLVTTQRQVVVLLTQSYPDTGAWYTVAVYYDVGLGQYSGFALNSRNEFGY